MWKVEQQIIKLSFAYASQKVRQLTSLIRTAFTQQSAHMPVYGILCVLKETSPQNISCPMGKRN